MVFFCRGRSFSHQIGGSLSRSLPTGIHCTHLRACSTSTWLPRISPGVSLPNSTAFLSRFRLGSTIGALISNPSGQRGSLSSEPLGGTMRIESSNSYLIGREIRPLSTSCRRRRSTLLSVQMSIVNISMLSKALRCKLQRPSRPIKRFRRLEMKVSDSKGRW